MHCKLQNLKRKIRRNKNKNSKEENLLIKSADCDLIKKNSLNQNRPTLNLNEINMNNEVNDGELEETRTENDYKNEDNEIVIKSKEQENKTPLNCFNYIISIPEANPTQISQNISRESVEKIKMITGETTTEPLN